ncbi:hypothetical protein [Gimesia alba]|nr:hypothetical protein [Gimesia alba]
MRTKAEFRELRAVRLMLAPEVVELLTGRSAGKNMRGESVQVDKGQKEAFSFGDEIEF